MEELNAPEGSKVVNLFHYAKDPSRTHGVPCKFVILEVGCLSRLTASADNLRTSRSPRRRSEYSSASGLQRKTLRGIDSPLSLQRYSNNLQLWKRVSEASSRWSDGF
jgi:hypothetical protein